MGGTHTDLKCQGSANECGNENQDFPRQDSPGLCLQQCTQPASTCGDRDGHFHPKREGLQPPKPFLVINGTHSASAFKLVNLLQYRYVSVGPDGVGHPWITWIHEDRPE